LKSRKPPKSLGRCSRDYLLKAHRC